MMVARILPSIVRAVCSDVPSSRTLSSVLAKIPIDAMTMYLARSGDVALTWQILRHVAEFQHYSASSKGQSLRLRQIICRSTI
jgi:hypothetical protein